MTKTFTLIGLVWAGFIALLGFVPWQFPPDPNLPNVASMLGYNISLAYLLILGWTMLAAGWLFVLSRDSVPLQVEIHSTPPLGNTRKWVERIGIAALVAAFYWPNSLARFGPHIEDKYFLSALWKMQCGEIPFSGFEFLYGPLMIIPLGGWISLFGFSQASYFAFYTLTQVAFFVILAAILQHFLARHLNRYLAFLVLLPLVMDLLLGLNWIAWRHFLALLAILLVAGNPRQYWAAILAGAAVGLQLAYSYEYGIAALIAVVAMYCALLFEPGRGPVLRNILLITISGIAGWAAIVWLLIGADFSAYLRGTATVSANAQANGLGQFAFKWTAHSLALFGLFSAVIVVGGRALAQLGKTTAAKGDLQMVGAIVFCLIALKIALQRADLYHLTVPFVPLAVVMFINVPTRLFQFTSPIRMFILVALTLASASQIVGHYPLGQWIVKASSRGAWQEFRGRDTVAQTLAGQSLLHDERSYPKKGLQELAHRMAAPDVAGKPILFYGKTWNTAMQVGVCPVGYSYYDILYSDEIAPLVDTARNTPELLVFMANEDYERLYLDVVQSEQDNPDRLRKTASWISSVHFEQSALESEIEYSIWKSHLGVYLRENFRLKERIAEIVLLERENE